MSWPTAAVGAAFAVLLQFVSAQSGINSATDDIITGSGNRPVVPEANVPTDLTCPSTADTNSVFLIANTTHPESLYTSFLAYNAILATGKVPAPPSGCNTAVNNENQINISSICAATVPDGFIVITNFVVTLQCGSFAQVQANVRINGSADDDVSLRGFNIGPWSSPPARPSPSPTVAQVPSPAVIAPVPAPVPSPAKAPAPSPTVPSPSPTPPPQCRGFVRPHCQFLVASSNVCCNDTGIVTALPYASLAFLCSANNIAPPSPSCLIIDGPEDYEIQDAFGGGNGYTLIYGNSSDQYSGRITVGLNQSGSCALQISGGCQYNQQVFTTVPQVDNLTFLVQNPEARQFYNWIPDAEDLNVLSSTSWLVTGRNASGKGCRSELNWELPPFFTFNFANYTSNSSYGFAYACDDSMGTTCTALNAPAPAPVLTAAGRT